MKTGMMRAAALPLLLIAAQAAAQQDPIAFATGNMSEAVKEMDVSHRGMISKEEFLRYEAEQFDKMKKNADGMVMDQDMLKYLKGPSGKQ